MKTENIWYNLNMKKRSIFQCSNEVTHGRGYVYSLKYHMVWCTKYRRQIFADGLELIVSNYLKETAKTLEMDILAMEVMPDYIHILASCKPQFRPSDAMKVLKGNTARWLFMNQPQIKEKLRDGRLWNPSYFVAMASEQIEEQVADYIRQQRAE